MLGIKPKNERTSWIYCPAVKVDGTPCRHDLNGDDKSFVDEDGYGIVHYTCAACGFGSIFSVNEPAPIYIMPWGFHATGQCGGVCKHCQFHPQEICDNQNCSGCCTEDEN